MAAALTPYALERRAPVASASSFVLAVAMHCLLFAFLYFGIRWQSSPPVAIEAELWSEPPRAAPAPPPAPAPAPAPAPPVVREEPKPEPAPPKPDIAVKEERKPEPKKEIKPKVEPKKDEKPRVDPIREALEKEDLKRQLAREAQKDEMAQKAAGESTAMGQRAQAEWGDRVKAKVRSRIPYSVASAVNGNPEATFEVTLLPGLEVGSVRLTRSSGNAAYDDAAERAIKAASPLPPPQSERVAIPRTLTLRMRPKDE